MGNQIATFHHYDFATTHALTPYQEDEIVKMLAKFAQGSVSGGRFRGAASFGKTREEAVHNFAIPVIPADAGKTPIHPEELR